MIDLDKLTRLIGNLDEDSAMDILDEFMSKDPDILGSQEIVSACQRGMELVGERYGTGEYFVGDLIFAGEMLTYCMDKLKPFLESEDTEKCGTIVLGTVEGDIHDIGKNIFMTLCEATGFSVIDIGIDKRPEAFVLAVQKYKPQIVGFSGVLTLSIDSMKRTVQALKSADLRDDISIIIGGNSASEGACKYVGADAWTRNASEAVCICSEWINRVSISKA